MRRASYESAPNVVIKDCPKVLRKIINTTITKFKKTGRTMSYMDHNNLFYDGTVDLKKIYRPKIFTNRFNRSNKGVSSKNNS